MNSVFMPEVGRRRFLGLCGVAAAALVAPGLAGCGQDGGGATTPGVSPSGTVRFGVNANAAIPTDGYDAVFKAFTDQTGIKIAPNKLLYTEQVNNYLQQAPDDVFIWNAGYRMRFFAEQGLVSDLSSVWDAGVGANVTEAVKAACTSTDGKPYLVPFYTYPWVMFYRKSVFADRGYTPPKTLAEFTALAKKMQADGLVPVAFADKEGWEAMGTFDILNMRLHGYDFHIALLDGKESWTDARVKATFAAWQELLPYHQTNPLGRTWQEAAQAVAQRKAGMYFLGSFISAQFPGQNFDDLDFFPFPELSPEHGQDAIDAPIDGFMMVAEPDNKPAAEEVLKFLGTGKAQQLYLKTDPNSVGTARDIDTASYTPLQKRYAELISSTPNIAQLLDRDTRPDFAAPVVLPAIQSFLRTPTEIDKILDSVQRQAETIFV